MPARVVFIAWPQTLVFGCSFGVAPESESLISRSTVLSLIRMEVRRHATSGSQLWGDYKNNLILLFYIDSKTLAMRRGLWPMKGSKVMSVSVVADWGGPMAPERDMKATDGCLGSSTKEWPRNNCALR